MNKAELIVALAGYSDDTELVIPGYECGMDPIGAVWELTAKEIGGEDYPTYFGKYLPSRKGKPVLLLAGGDMRWNSFDADKFRELKKKGWL